MSNISEMDFPSFCDWYNEHYPDRIPHRPKITSVVYFEYCATGEGIQIDKETFDEYLQLFKYIDTFSYSYDRQNDCTVYKIDGNPIFRLFKWGCLS